MTPHGPLLSCFNTGHRPQTATLFAGGASLHLCMTPHGPDTKTFEAATAPEAEQIGHLPKCGLGCT